jgi:hypothetical protein
MKDKKLIKIEITSSQRKLEWNIIKPENYPDCKPLYWMKITEPNR